MLIKSFFKNIFSNEKTQNEAEITSVYDIKINSIDGSPLDLHQFKGKKIMFVNVASECGFTGQYEELQKLSENHKDDLVVIGLPCNQFGSQEPGSEGEIQTFCEKKYGVTFPLTEKIEVKGENQHLLYRWLTKKENNGVKSSSLKWNFQKYLIDENGEWITYWYSLTKPLSTKIEKYL